MPRWLRLKLPVIRGVIERRLLLNYRVSPGVLQRLLPPPFRPKEVAGWGMGGICLIRLGGIRPRGAPAWLGLRSENAAHRFAVEWDGPGGIEEGVFVARRDTDSRWNVWAGGRLFPGVHHRARFDVREEGDLYRVAMRSRDGETRMLVHAEAADALPADSVFSSPAAASRFFECGTRGYSPAPDGGLEGIELRTLSWTAVPLAVHAIESNCFDDGRLFPVGTAVFDSALLMRNIEHEWHACGECASAAALAGYTPAVACRTSE